MPDLAFLALGWLATPNAKPTEGYTVDTLPMTELEMMVRVAVNPLVQQYRKSMQDYRNRMVAAYGPDFDAEYAPKSVDEMDGDPRGIKVMTDRERSTYGALHVRLIAVRKLVRDHYSK